MRGQRPERSRARPSPPGERFGARALAGSLGAPVGLVGLVGLLGLGGAGACGGPPQVRGPASGLPAGPAAGPADVWAAPSPEGLPPSARRAHARCVEGSAAACTALGLASQDGRGVPHDEARAAGYFARACALARDPAASSCADLGALLLEGEGVPHDRARAQALFQEGCAAGYGRACAALGYMDRDPRAAAPKLRRGCDLGSGWGCFLWAKQREAALGTGSGGPAGRAAVLKAYATGCAQRYPAACVGAGRLGLAMAGQPGAPSARECARWLLKGCQGGEADGCARLGRLLQRGAPGVPPNPDQAAQLLRAACEAGEASACGPAPPPVTR